MLDLRDESPRRFCANKAEKPPASKSSQIANFRAACTGCRGRAPDPEQAQDPFDQPRRALGMIAIDRPMKVVVMARNTVILAKLFFDGWAEILTAFNRQVITYDKRAEVIAHKKSYWWDKRV
jgi:hypothetical protein